MSDAACAPYSKSSVTYLANMQWSNVKRCSPGAGSGPGAGKAEGARGGLRAATWRMTVAGVAARGGEGRRACWMAPARPGMPVRTGLPGARLTDTLGTPAVGRGPTRGARCCTVLRAMRTGWPAVLCTAATTTAGRAGAATGATVAVGPLVGAATTGVAQGVGDGPNPLPPLLPAFLLEAAFLQWLQPTLLPLPLVASSGKPLRPTRFWHLEQRTPCVSGVGVMNLASKS
mmetsp:Transcript_4633/g.11437  ORF Transcript_4633/g.11437 Transcript_4633/m.11437 type:complete len:230 (+) Transcript_4633:1227-1916(+)